MIILYKQFNFGLAPQTFGLVTSSNSLPKGQPYLFIFVSPWLPPATLPFGGQVTEQKTMRGKELDRLSRAWAGLGQYMQVCGKFVRMF